MIDIQQLDLMVFNPRRGDADLVNSCYSLWKQAWKDIYPSDNFDRQDEALALLHFGRPIALVMHRYQDLRHHHLVDDSYFLKFWPKYAIDKLSLHGNRLVMGSQITIAPEYRKTVANQSIKELITYCSFSHLKDNRNIDVISGMMRLGKGVDSLFYKSGAVPLAQNVPFHDMSLDLVCFYPRVQPINIPTDFQDSIKFLTSKNASIGEVSYEYKKSG